MRAGALKHRGDIYRLPSDLVAVKIGSVRMAVVAKEGDAPDAASLRNPSKISIKTRYSAKLQQGTYLRVRERLFFVDSARDVIGNKQELAVTATEFVGMSGLYRPESGAQLPCMVHLTFAAPYRDEMGKVTEYRTRAEVALIETGRVQPDEQLMVDGVSYLVLGYVDESDDGVVRQLWLQPMEA